MDQEKRKRLFIAIDLPAEIRNLFVSVSGYFQHPAVRWTPAQNLHITTHFLGTVPEKHIEGIQQQISVVAAKASPFLLSFSQLKTITKGRRPLMIWAAFEQSDAFVELALQFQAQLPGDASKAPTPHITLARIKVGGLKELPPPPVVTPFSIAVTKIELWESKLGSKMPEYHAVRKFELGSVTR